MRAAVTIVCALLSFAAVAAERPGLTPTIGAQLPTDLALADASGAVRPLGDHIGDRPALLLLGYHHCPNLCDVTMERVAAAARETGLDPAGYRAIFASIDDAEVPADARATRARLASAGGGASLTSWRFLTGADGAGRALAEAAGLEFSERPHADQFVHPVGVLVLTPDGRISRALPAFPLEPADLRLALVESSSGTLGSLLDRAFLLCSAFDAERGRYTPAVWTAVQIGGVLTLAALGLVLLRLRGGRA